MNDPFHRPDLSGVRRMAIEEALDELRHVAQFHTRDVIEHRSVQVAHRDVVGDADFGQLVHDWLERHALELGLRGPLPGHPGRGERWAWHLEEAQT